MVDTVMIVIHNQSNYKLYDTFECNSSDGSYSVDIVKKDNKVTASEITGQYFSNSDNFIITRKSDRLYNPSSNYYVGYKFDIAADELQFEFSMPKYVYGHNIAQLIDYYDQHPGKCYDVFLRTVYNFLDKNLHVRVSDYDIEVRRIDMCFNQFFQSKEVAIQYLDSVKRQFERLARLNGSVPVPYETGCHYTTRRYSFKVYHKGTEFRKHDYYELLKNNPRNYDIERTADAADRILRYEITYRLSGLNYFFQQEFEKKKLVSFSVKSSVYRNVYYYLRPFKKDFSKSFRLKSEYETLPLGNTRAMLNRLKQLKTASEVCFTSMFFQILYQHYHNLFLKVQVKMGSDVISFNNKLKELNSKLSKIAAIRPVQLMNENRMIAWYKLSQLPGGLKRHALKKGLMSDRQYYYVLKRFRLMGYEDYNPSLSLVIPDNGYSSYKEIFSSLH